MKRFFKFATITVALSFSVFCAVYAATRNYYHSKSATPNYSETLYSLLSQEKNNSDITTVTNNVQVISDFTNTESSTTSDLPQNYEVQRNSDFSKIKSVNVYNHINGEIITMPLDDYVAAVTVAEMPTDSPSEALKAQTVAVRTLAVSAVLDTDKTAHCGADICTNPAHCQGYSSKKDFIQKYGESGEQVFLNAENAAKATSGIILLYKNQPIIAAFHASSGNRTASSSEVWGGSLDYLVSVESPELADDELKEKVINQITFTKEEFINALNAAGVAISEECKKSPFHLWISGKELSDSGRVAEINIGGKIISGSQLRSYLGLKSSNFEISYDNDNITFITTGYGHGVGMSQLGAVAMAKKGESFNAILQNYYPGTILEII